MTFIPFVVVAVYPSSSFASSHLRLCGNALQNAFSLRFPRATPRARVKALSKAWYVILLRGEHVPPYLNDTVIKTQHRYETTIATTQRHQRPPGPRPGLRPRTGLTPGGRERSAAGLLTVLQRTQGNSTPLAGRPTSGNTDGFPTTQLPHPPQAPPTNRKAQSRVDFR